MKHDPRERTTLPDGTDAAEDAERRFRERSRIMAERSLAFRERYQPPDKGGMRTIKDGMRTVTVYGQ